MALIETLQSFLKAEKVQCSKIILIFVYVRQNSTSEFEFLSSDSTSKFYMKHWIFEFDIEVNKTNVLWEPKMLIGRLYRCQSNGAWNWGSQRPVPEVFPRLFRRFERKTSGSQGNTYQRLSPFFLLWVWESAPAMFRHSPRGTQTEAGKHIAQTWITLYDLFSVTRFCTFGREEMYNYHPTFCYPTQTTHGQKVSFVYPLFKDFPLIPRFRIIRIFRVLEYSVYSSFQNIRYFPCFRIFRVFRILEYSVYSVIPPFRSSIPFHHSTTPWIGSPPSGCYA